MNPMNERIAAVVAASGLSKTAFAQKISVSQQHVSRLCSDGAPSDRTILDICREFGVDELWLREGIGEMFRERTRAEDIAAFAGAVLKAGDDDFRNTFVGVLSQLSVDEWALLEAMANKLVAEYKKETEQ